MTTEFIGNIVLDSYEEISAVKIKRGLNVRNRALLTITGIVVLTLLSCAAIRRSEAERTDKLLAAAGFKILPADTPQKLQMLQSLPPLKLQYRVKDGNPLYFFADPYDCKCIYTGDEAAYDRFQRLAEQAQIAEEEQQAALMNEESAMQFSPFGWGWMGGPWGLW